MVVVLGQADNRANSRSASFGSIALPPPLWPPGSDQELVAELMDTWVQFRPAVPRFDQYLNWLKYQALAERIWSRRGFYQASGAFGFRDQLQDAVNLIWMDPALARRQILLHSAQQFPEGDVVHWFHRLQDGRTGFVGRTHASDNLLWLAWAVVEYVAATGDDSLLEERNPLSGSGAAVSPFPGRQAWHGVRSAASRSVPTLFTGIVWKQLISFLTSGWAATDCPSWAPATGMTAWTKSAARAEEKAFGSAFSSLHPGAHDAHHPKRRGRAARKLPGKMRNSRKLWSGPGAAIVICAPSTTTAPRSAWQGSGVWEIDALDCRLGGHVRHQPRARPDRV